MWGAMMVARVGSLVRACVRVCAEAYTLIGADQSTYARFARTLRGLDSNDLVAGLSLAQNNL